MEWIKCSERMPEKRLQVWLTIRGHDVIVPMKWETFEQAQERINRIRWVTQGFLGSDGWYGADGFPMVVTPIAWMPIDCPEPYGGEE